MPDTVWPQHLLHRALLGVGAARDSQRRSGCLPARPTLPSIGHCSPRLCWNRTVGWSWSPPADCTREAEPVSSAHCGQKEDSRPEAGGRGSRDVRGTVESLLLFSFNYCHLCFISTTRMHQEVPSGRRHVQVSCSTLTASSPTDLPGPLTAGGSLQRTDQETVQTGEGANQREPWSAKDPHETQVQESTFSKT